jgi:hypothetical protein
MTQEERIKRMREAGIPMPITQMSLSEGSVSAIPVTAQNADKHARLQALKSGANKQQVQSLVKATSQQQQGFQGIPEVKQKRRPQGHPGQDTPVQTVPVENNFGPVAPISGELAAIEAMMGGSSPAYNQPAPQMNMNMAQDTSQPELTVDQGGYGPTFDPVGMLAKKRQQMQSNQYMQFAQQETVENALAPLQQAANPNQQNFDFQNMQKMMEQIAKNTISEVLNSYTEKNKDKLTYENVNVKTPDGTQVIKTQDGKYYKLVPVKLKKS